VLEEVPSLELAATAVAVVLILRAIVLWRRVGVMGGRRRVESARARDLIGVAILVGALVYAMRMGRASPWFLVMLGAAVVAQLLGFYWRSAASGKSAPNPGQGATPAEPEVDFEDEDLLGCPSCGHAELIELDETSPLLAQLGSFTPVVAVICPSCGSLSGQVDDPKKIPIDAQHGTSLRAGPSTEDHEALEAPAEHDG
jgi:hypothetical protein